MSQKNIKLHFFRSSSGERNFGDELSPLIVELVGKRKVSWSDINKCEMVSLGSILDSAVRKVIYRKLQMNFSPIYVWGTGSIQVNSLNMKHFKVHSLRGPLTYQCLNIENEVPFGDPGLLSKHLVSASIKTITTLIIPHVIHRKNKEITYLKNSLPSAVVADLTEEPLKILKLIASSERVISSSLHGLICSDSLGVPNIRLNLGNKLKGGDFKFDDYRLSVCRGITNIIGTESEEEITRKFEFSDFSYQKELDLICEKLIESFPLELLS